MTDYFALLDQHRSPWIDADQLKQAFHSKSLRLHPDAQPRGSAESASAFAELNEAYQVLQDPKRRLQHLLALHGDAPGSRFEAVPEDVAELFSRVADVTQNLQQLPQQFAAATSPLSQALLKPQLLKAQNAVAEMLAVVRARHAESIARLRGLAAEWEQDGSAGRAELHQLYLRFSYLSRWIAELEEKQTQLVSF